MLENVKKQINKRVRKTFEEKYIDYVLSVQEVNLELEIDFFKRHNKMDVLQLDRMISLEINEVF